MRPASVKAALIPQHLGRGHCLAKVLADSHILGEPPERRAQSQSDLDPLLQMLAGVGQMPRRLECLFEICGGPAVGRTCLRFQAGVARVHHSQLPQRGAQGIVGEPLDVLGEPVNVRLPVRVGHAGVQDPTSFLEQAAVRDLLREGELEGVHRLRKQAGCVQELGSPKYPEHAIEFVVVSISEATEQRGWDIFADHGGRLKQRLHCRWKAVDSGRHHALDGGRYSHLGNGLGRRYAPRSPTTTSVSTSEQTLSSKNSGLACVRPCSNAFNDSSDVSSPSSSDSSTSTRAVSSGSIRIWVQWLRFLHPCRCSGR
ncbi:MAG: hypothetical protein IT306_26445 [Chloroflexi bacterium]|nr:hypothetical protein [Chloroflexota bacterium]